MYCCLTIATSAPAATDPPVQHRLLAAAALEYNSASRFRFKTAASGEADVVDWIDNLLLPRPTLVTWDGIRFVLPVVLARALQHRRPLQQLYGGRYLRRFADLHADLGDWARWKLGGGEPIPLNGLLRVLGYPELPEQAPTVVRSWRQTIGQLAEQAATLMALKLQQDTAAGLLRPEQHRAALWAALAALRDPQVLQNVPGLRSRLVTLGGIL